MSATLHHFTGDEANVQRLGIALGIDCHPIEVRHFPDGESLVRVVPGDSSALLYCSLDNPDAKLFPLLLAASALRDGGAKRIVLIAPYLGYMRQDRAFASGEAVSQRVMGNLISEAFDGLVTVDPHLHRTPNLADVVPGIEAINVPAAPFIAHAIADFVTPDTLLVGPDVESRPWAEAIGASLRLEVAIGQKLRAGDREVEISIPDSTRADGRPVILVDDLISSGGTLIACAKALFAAGATSVGAVATHCLASRTDLDVLANYGIRPVLATDTVPGPAALIPMAAALAAAIRSHGIM